MKITIEIPDDCYGEYFDDDDNLIVQEPPIGDRAKREKLLERFFMSGKFSALIWLS